MDEVFHLKAPFQPTGDQPQAIEALMQGIHEGDDAQTLLGVTGSGKTFTMANIIAPVQSPDADAWSRIKRWPARSVPRCAAFSPMMR